MPLRFAIDLVLSIICLAAPAWADYEAGMDAYKHEDYATALREWRPLAERGDARAQHEIGWMYFIGIKGVPLDYVQGRQWLEKAATQGNAEAQFSLGMTYEMGLWEPKDYQKALFWFHLAADQRNAIAQRKLGTMYGLGDGVPQDFAQAHMWYNLAAAKGDELAATWCNRLAKQMTPDQIAEAQKLAREWTPKGK